MHLEVVRIPSAQVVGIPPSCAFGWLVVRIPPSCALGGWLLGSHPLFPLPHRICTKPRGTKLQLQETSKHLNKQH